MIGKTKIKIHIFLIAAILQFISSDIPAQTSSFLSGGTDEYLRRSQLTGLVDQAYSFTIRSFSTNINGIDSLLPLTKISFQQKNAAWKGGYQPFTTEQLFNSAHPYGWNDGSLIPAAGASVRISGGIHAQMGRFSLQLQPELVVSENGDFETFFSAYFDTTWSRYYQWLNKSDIPERFGTNTFKKLFGGQSSFRYNGNYNRCRCSTRTKRPRIT